MNYRPEAGNAAGAFDKTGIHSRPGAARGILSVKRAMRAAAALCMTGLVISMLSGCAMQDKLYDNEEAMAKRFNSMTAVNYRVSSGGEEGASDFTIGMFSGIRAMEEFTVGEEGGVFSFTCGMEVESGDFKLVLVDLSSETVLETILEGSGEAGLEDYALEPGDYAVKAVGARAKVEGSYQIVLPE